MSSDLKPCGLLINLRYLVIRTDAAVITSLERMLSLYFSVRYLDTNKLTTILSSQFLTLLWFYHPYLYLAAALESSNYCFVSMILLTVKMNKLPVSHTQKITVCHSQGWTLFIMKTLASVMIIIMTKQSVIYTSFTYEDACQEVGN